MASYHFTTAAITSKGIRILGFSSTMCFASTTHPSCVPMKSGTPLHSLDIYKEAESPPVAFECSQYPSWISDFLKPLISLATL
jgi:hypothetical protein